MIDDKTIEQLKTEGYDIHKRMDKKLLKRRNEIYNEISKYIMHAEYVYHRQYGEYPYVYCLEQYAQDRVRKAMKKLYGTLNYQDIPDGRWLEVRKEMIETAKNYIDYRIRKAKAGLG